MAQKILLKCATIGLLAVSLVFIEGSRDASFAGAPAISSLASNKEQVLQAPDGRSLYVFDDDAPGQSNCSGECLKLWPPFLAAAGDKADDDFSIISRSDSEAQWAYKSRPLYLFSRDVKAGDTNGNSFNGNRWHIAKP